MKKAFSIIGMLAGLAIIAFGIYIAVSDKMDFKADFADYASFGADFYTYQYKATTYAVSNLYSIGLYIEDVVRIAGYVIAAVGLVIFCAFGVRLGEASHETIKLKSDYNTNKLLKNIDDTLQNNNSTTNKEISQDLG